VRELIQAKHADVVDGVARYAFTELDPARLLTEENVGSGLAGLDLDGDVLREAFRGPIRAELKQLKASYRDQFAHVLDHLDPAVADDVDRRDAYVDDDLFLVDYEGDRLEALREDLGAHFDRVVEAFEPVMAIEPHTVVDADEATVDHFWELVAEVYTEEEARNALDALAGHPDVIVPYEDGLAIEIDLRDTPAPIDALDYTAEAMRVVQEGVHHHRDVQATELAKAYG
jgi:enamine deaminase RidA (YjgF/YER057c/UK114 family)